MYPLGVGNDRLLVSHFVVGCLLSGTFFLEAKSAQNGNLLFFASRRTQVADQKLPQSHARKGNCPLLGAAPNLLGRRPSGLFPQRLSSQGFLSEFSHILLDSDHQQGCCRSSNLMTASGRPEGHRYCLSRTMTSLHFTSDFLNRSAGRR